MITREQIVDSIKYVVENSTYVTIHPEHIEKVITLLPSIKRESWVERDFFDSKKYSQKDLFLYLLLYESLNFCYWDSDIKWKIQYKEKWYSGSYGLSYALLKAIQEGYPLLEIETLKNMTIEELDTILKGTTSIPLLTERYTILKQVVEEFTTTSASTELLEATSDIELLNRIQNHFHNFRDISLYKGKEIYFFKRATLLVGDLIFNMDAIREKVKNDNQMLACADYKIPQVLRHLGILEYSKELSLLVDNSQIIEHDSEMEIEIRASMVYAIELIKEQLEQKGIYKSAVEIDNALWLLSKNQEFKEKPHHLSRTIYY